MVSDTVVGAISAGQSLSGDVDVDGGAGSVERAYEAPAVFDSGSVRVVTEGSSPGCADVNGQGFR
jgi:hypothetical protein